MGTVTNLFIKTEHHKPLLPVNKVEVKTGIGILNNIHNDASSPRQVLLIDKETLGLFNLKPGDVRENITTEGLNFSKIGSKDLIKIGEAEIRITFDCEPCSFIETLEKGLVHKIKGKRGKLAVVIKDGKIKIGDKIEIIEKNYFEEIPSKAFDRVAWIIRQIPQGKVITYKQLIISAGLFSVYYRVFPSYLEKLKNTDLPIHRVIDSHNQILKTIDKQEKLLKSENILVTEGRINSQYLWTPINLYTNHRILKI